MKQHLLVLVIVIFAVATAQDLEDVEHEPLPSIPSSNFKHFMSLFGQGICCYFRKMFELFIPTKIEAVDNTIKEIMPRFNRFEC
ncbi:unnamed protein product [Ceutorhynchus assimilis]|uniref:Uncharacterized protein n=1 Tax=Ceutorhynchus assimilis TaxID=467358 RepID=A0A9N9N139_9CUCU|nr:unnamed protein product [Ceutorhynchus assimilis]